MIPARSGRSMAREWREFVKRYYRIHKLFNGMTCQKSAQFKGILCEVLFSGGSALLLLYSVGSMASCSCIPQIMLNNVGLF